MPLSSIPRRLLQRISESTGFRAEWALLGVRYGRSSNFNSQRLTIGKTTIDLQYPQGEKEEQEEELGTILHDDCYGLKQLSSPPKRILDVGGNLGLFSLVARARFPEALIHTYEPWPKLQPMLANNLGALNITLHPEAVGKEDGSSTMEDRGPSGAGVNRSDPLGDITTVSFDRAIERIGGKVDLLKLDCEGGEWEILQCEKAMRSVDRLVMEYHLWSGDRPLGELIETLINLGFHIDHLCEIQTGFNGLLWASHKLHGQYGRARQKIFE